MTPTKIAWTDLGSNQILDAGNFYISYNGYPDNKNFLGELAALLSGDESMKDIREETALYDGKKWRILNGDFREEYEAAYPDWKNCLAVYRKHKAQPRSPWSTD